MDWETERRREVVCYHSGTGTTHATSYWLFRVYVDEGKRRVDERIREINCCIGNMGNESADTNQWDGGGCGSVTGFVCVIQLDTGRTQESK